MKRLLAFLIIVLIGAGASAQQQPSAKSRMGMIRGIVVDSKDNSPIGFANVVLKRQRDSSFVKGAATALSGEFLLATTDEGQFSLTVSYVGYSRKTIPNISLSNVSPEVNLGAIKIEATGVQMDGVQVVGERREVEFRPDKKVINVAKNLQAVGGTAIDALQNQPSVQVDSDGNLTLRGSSNYTVLVNGRPSPLQGSDALRQIPANTIDNIEIITNPSAKYDAEGTVGIINVITKTIAEYTVSGLANLGVGTRNKYNGDASANISQDKFTVNGGADYRSTSMYMPMTMERSSFGAQSFSSFTDMYRKLTRQALNLRAGIDYRLNPQHQLTLSGTYGRLKFLGDWNSKVRNTADALETYSYVENRIDVPAKYYQAQFFYTFKFVPSVDELSFEATYTHLNLPNRQTTDEYESDDGFIQRSPNPLLQKLANDAKRNDGRLKLNFSHKFNPKSTLEAGVQSNLSYREFAVAFSTFSWDANAWLGSSEFSNNFDLRSNVYAGFITYSNSLYDFDFQVGIRAEQMDRLLDLKTLVKKYELKKLDFFPSFSLSRKIGEHTLQFSYSRRITRPNEGFLNPVPFYSDSYFRVTGNPELQPEYIHSYELNYQKQFQGIFVNLQTYLRSSKGLFIQTQTMDSEGRLVFGFQNLGTSQTLGAELSGGFSLGSAWRFDPSVTLNTYRQEGNVLDDRIDVRATTWNARLNTTVTVTPTTRLQVTSNYFGKQTTGQTEIKPRFLLGASVRQDFLNKQLSVTLLAQNLLKTANFNLTNASSTFQSSQTFRPELQIVNLTLSYNFNNFKRTAAQTIDIQNEVGR